jgi:putative MATE family efflux protein
MLKLMKQPRGFYAGVFAIMIPMILQNLISQTVAFADTFMVGMLGQDYLAAVTTATAPFFIIMVLMMGIQSGAGILIAQYWGKRNTNAINRVLGVGFYFSFIFSFLGAMVVFLFPEFILGLIINDRHIVELGIDYARIAGFAQMLSSISGIYIASQRSMENTKLGFVVLTISSLFNLFGNWVLIFGHFGLPALGIKGAAISTLISRMIEIIIVVIYALRNKRFKLHIKLVIMPGIIILKDFVKYSLPVIINEALWGLGAVIYPVILGHMANSSDIMAAYTIAGNLERLFSVAVFAAGGATAVIIGREIGAGRTSTVYSVGRSMIMLALLLGAASGSLLLLASLTVLEPLIYPLFQLTPVAAQASTTMLMILSFITVIRTVGFTLGIGVLRGGGDVKYVMLIDIGTLYLIAMPAAAVSGLALGAGIAVVYACMALEDVSKTVLLLWRFRSKKWINDVTRDELK